MDRSVISMENDNKRIVVCSTCGCLYDIHYVDKVRGKKDNLTHFECKNCGMVPLVTKASG